MQSPTATAIGLVLAIAVFGVIANHARDMYKDRKYREMSGSLFWAIIPIAIFAVFWVVNESPPEMARNITLGFVGAVLGAAGLIWCGYFLSASARPKSGATAVAQGGPTINTWNQSGGTNTIIIGTPTPPRLAFDQEIANDLANKLPKGKPILFQAIGYDEDQAVANQYFEFLKVRGFNIPERNIIGTYLPPPTKKISILDEGARVVVTVAPSAH